MHNDNEVNDVAGKPTIQPRGARAARLRRKTVKCFALTATGARVIYNRGDVGVKNLFSDYSNLFKGWELTSRMSAITDSIRGLPDLGYLTPIRSPFEGFDSIVWQHRDLIGTTVAVSAFSDALFSVRKSIPQLDAYNVIATQIAQTTQLTSGFDVSRLVGEIPKMIEINNSLYADASKIWNTLRPLTEANQQFAVQLASISAPLEGFVDLLNKSQVRLSIFEDIKPLITSNMASAMIAAIPQIDTDVFDLFKGFDWSALSLNMNAGVLAYDGEEYSLVEIEETALQFSADTASTPATSRTAKLFNLVKVIIVLIFSLYTAPAQIAESTAWYKENIPGIIESLAQIMGIEYTAEDVYVFVINERGTPLRSEADVKATKIFQLPFDSRLRVLSEVPRWREVEYSKEDGEIVTGWVAKVSIEYEDALK